MHPSMDVDATYAVPHPPPGQTSAQANSSSHVRTHLQVLIPNPRSYSPSSSLSSSFLGTPNDSPRASKQRTPRSLSEAHSSCDEQQTPDPLNSSRKLRRKAQQQQQSSNTSRQSHHSIMEALAPMSPGDVMLVPKPPSLSTARGPDSGRALRVDTTTGSGTQPSSAQLPPVTVGGPTTPTSTLWWKLVTSVTPSETSSRRLFPLNGSNLGPPPPVNNTATVSTAFCADSQIGRLLNWLLRCSARLGDVVGGISEASAENIKLENLANFGRRHSCASIPINTPRHGVSLEPLTPQASRRGSRSSSVNSDGNHSRSSSIGSGTERERPSSSARAPPSLRQHSSSRSSFQSNGSLPPITRCTQDRSQDISTQALVLMKEQMEQVHHQLLDEIRFLASRSFLLMTDDATQRFLELCECLLFDWTSIWTTVHADLEADGAAGDKAHHRSDEDLHRIVFLLLDNAEVDWAVHKKEVLKWMVKLIGSGSISLLQLLTSVVPIMETVSARDAKFLVSCVVSSIDGTGKGDAAGSLGVLLSTLPHTFQIRQNAEMLKPVWQEAVTHVLRVKNGRTHRKQLLYVLCSATMTSGSGSGNARSTSHGSLFSSGNTSEQQKFGVLSNTSMSHHPTRVQIDFDTVESNDKQTIFSRACREGDAELVKIIIGSRVELGITTFTRTQSDGTNALQQATARGHVDVVGLLCTLSNDDILGAFEAKVPGKGNVLEIAESLSKTAIAHMLVDRVPWLTSVKRKAAVEAEPSQIFLTEDGQFNAPGQSLDSIHVVVTSLDDQDVAPNSSKASNKPSPPPPEPAVLNPMEEATKQLRTSSKPWSSALRAFLHVFEPSPYQGFSTAIEALTHDDAQVMQKLFERSNPRKEVNEEQLKRDVFQLVTIVRVVMQEYLQLPELTVSVSPNSKRGAKPPSKSENVRLPELTKLPGTCRELSSVVAHVLSITPAYKAGGKSAARQIPLQTLLPGSSSTYIGAAFGMGGGDQAPMPSRVQRFLAVAAAALARTEDTTSYVKLGHIAFADDWLLGSLRINGMFPVVMGAVFTPATMITSPDLRMLTEAPDVSSPPPLLGRVLQFSLMILQHLLPSEQPDALHVRDTLLTRMGSSGEAMKYISIVQGAAKVSPLASSVSSKGEASFTNGNAYAFNVRILTTRLFALHVITELHNHRNVLIPAVSTVYGSNDPLFEGSTFSFDRPPTSDLKREVGNSYLESRVPRGHDAYAIPLGALLWIGSRTFCELDAVDILFSAPRVQAFGWLAAVVSSSATHDTQPVSYLADQPWWPALADSIVTPVEDVLYFRTRPCAKVFHVKGAPPQAMRELLNAFLSRAAATGDCTLLQRAFAAKDGVEIMHPQRPEAPLGWQPGACGLTPLMLAILCGQRPVVEFLVQWARTLKSGKALLQTCVTGLSPLATPADGIDSMWISRRIGDTEATMSLVGALEKLS